MILNSTARERFESWYFDRFCTPVMKVAQGTYGGGTYYSFPDDERLYEAWIAALSYPSTPQGWKLVPVEPELVMLQAGRDLDLEAPGNGWLTNLPHYELRDIWQAMLNAAPPPPEQGGKG